MARLALAISLLFAFIPASAWAASPALAATDTAAPAPVESVQETLPPPNPESEAVIEKSASMDRDTLAVISTQQLAEDIVPLTRDELETLAGEALESARLRTVEVVEARKASPRRLSASGAAAPTQDDLARYDAKMLRLVDLRGEAFERLDMILDEWEEKGGDADKIEEYRAYRRAVVSDTVAKLTFGGAWRGIKHWAVAPDGGIRLAKGIAVFLLALVLLFYFARLARAGVSRTLTHTHKASHLLQAFIGLLVFWTVILIGLTLVIASFGFDLTPVFAVLGGASFVIAFAMQETLGNFAAGLMILVYRPFDQGERVIAAGVDGTVRKLNLTSTVLVTPDNQLVTVPNAKVWNDVIINAVDLGKRRIDLDFRIRDAAQALGAVDGLAEFLKKVPGVVAQPEPEIYFGDFDGRGASLQVRPWTRSKAYWPTRRAVTKAMIERLAEQKIELWALPLERKKA